jgi:hypothetical protein
MVLIISIARFALVPLSKLFLRALGFGSLGPVLGKDIYFKTGKMAYIQPEKDHLLHGGKHFSVETSRAGLSLRSYSA